MPSPFRSTASQNAEKHVKILTELIEKNARKLASDMQIYDNKGNPHSFKLLEQLDQEATKIFREKL